jgi:DNA-binding transcriptional LysR family regulator
MDLRRLTQFVAVAETLHFGRAAERLSMAQPPLSRAIRSLEEELGVALFERNKKRVVLSDAGHALLPDAKALLAAADGLARTARSAAEGERGSLTLAFVSIVDYSFLPRLLRRFTQTYPGIRVALREATSDVQLQALARSEIDAGILLGPLVDAAVAGMTPETFAYQRLQTEALVLALPDTHPRAKSSAPVALRGLSSEAFISFPRQIAPRLHDAIIGACSEAGFSPRIVQEAIQMQTIISLVSAGMGVALVPESLMSLKRPGVVYRKLRGKRTAALELGLAWRRDNPAGALRRFVALAAQSRD